MTGRLVAEATFLLGGALTLTPTIIRHTHRQRTRRQAIQQAHNRQHAHHAEQMCRR